MVCTISCFTFSIPAHAQDATLTASVSTNPVGVAERFQVTFSGNTQFAKFRPPSFEGFAVLSGPNQSTSVQIVNGSMSQVVAVSYILQAKAEGKFTIQSATAEANGRQIQSNPLAIQVVKATSQSQQQIQQKAAESAAEAAMSKQVQQNLFLKVSANKISVTRGEQLVATYKLYTRVSLVNYTPRKMPALTGFWSQDIDNAQQLNFTDEHINGQTFRVAAVKKVTLFPQQSGTLELDPMEADVIARVMGQQRGGSPFDQLFGGDPFGRAQDVKLTLKSNPLKITVKALPQNGVPTEFAGAVGAGFVLDASLSSKSTKTNDPVKLKIRVSGKGNLKLLDPIKMNFPPDIETYDPTVTDNVAVTESGASGSRTFEYLLIPRYAGEFKIAPIRFAYYDLEKKHYNILSSQEFTLNVEKGKDDNKTVITSAAGVNKESVTAIGSDIRYIKSVPSSLSRKGDGFFGSAGFMASLLAPVCLFIGFVFYRRRTEDLRSNIVLMKNRGATKAAKQRLKQAQRFLAQQENNKFHDEIAKAIWGYMSDKLNIPPASLTRESVATTLAARGVSQTVVQQFALTLDTCEFARFAPSKDTNAMEHLYDDALELMSNIERDLK